jgi:hypothetical protein
MNTTRAYFQQGITEVPNLTISIGGVSDTSNATELDRYITRYETEFMKCLLGSLYTDYATNPTDAKWATLKAMLWDSTLLVSPVANYIFWHYYNDATRRNGNVGTVESNVENGNINTNARLVQVWNEMVSMMYNGVDGVIDYLLENSDTYPIEDYKWTNFVETTNILGI